MRIRVVLFLMIAMGCTMALPGAAYAKKPRITVHVHQSSDTVVWNKSTFQVSPNGSVYANHYTHQTIKDFAGLLQSYGQYDIQFIPVGHKGAIPHHLRDYAYCTLLEHGVRVSNYQPNHCQVRWGQSTFHMSHGSIYANQYHHQTIDDLVDLHAYLGLRQIQLIPVGHHGAIPNHLRPYALNRLNQRGIKVTNTQPKTIRQLHKRQKPRPEEVILDAFVDILETQRHR